MSIDLRAWAEDQWMVQIACLDRKLKQWLIEHVGTIRSELTRPEQTTLERILVDRIVISRLQVFHASKVSRESEDFSDRQAGHARACMDAANRRGRIATRELGTLRKHLYPKPRSARGRQQ